MTDPTGRVRRIDGTVHRPTAYWSPAVHDLLRYLGGVDFPAPRVLAVENGIEVLSWIDGESGPAGWAKVVPEKGLRAWAALLRRYHDVVANYRRGSIASGRILSVNVHRARSSAMETSDLGMAYGKVAKQSD